MAALAHLREPLPADSCVRVLGTGVEGIALAGGWLGGGVHDIAVDLLGESGNADLGVLAGGGVRHGPADLLVVLVPLAGGAVAGWTAEGDGRSAKVGGEGGVDGPGELQGVEGAPAGNGVVAGLGAVGLDAVGEGDVVGVAAAGDVVEGIVGRGGMISAIGIEQPVGVAQRGAAGEVVGSAALSDGQEVGVLFDKEAGRHWRRDAGAAAELPGSVVIKVLAANGIERNIRHAARGVPAIGIGLLVAGRGEDLAATAARSSAVL